MDCAAGYDEVVGDEGLIGDQEMISDEGALDAFYPDEPFNVTLNKRLPLVRRRATFGRTRLTPRSYVWHERPVRQDNDNVNVNVNANAIFLTKRQDQAVTCGLEKNYYPGVCSDFIDFFQKKAINSLRMRSLRISSLILYLNVLIY